MPQALRELKVGQKIGRFKVRGKLGRGSAGWVVRAEDTTLKRSVALKLLAFESRRDTSHREAAEAFLAEARRAAQLVHPGIVQILEIGRTNQLVFIAMELLEGGTLEQKLKEEGTLPWRRAVEWIIEACGPLGYAHQQGVIHRDVKPANLMLTSTGHVKVMDFGLAYAEMAAEAEAANRQIAPPEGAVAGTPYFMAPEVLRGQSSARSDVFALAASLWHLLTGAPPFDIQKLTDVSKIGRELSLCDFSEARPDVPAPIGRVLGEALDPDPEQRHADANALGEALRAAVNEVDIPVARPARQPATPAAAGSHRRTIVLAATIALVLGAGIAIAAAFLFGPLGDAYDPDTPLPDQKPTPTGDAEPAAPSTGDDADGQGVATNDAADKPNVAADDDDGEGSPTDDGAGGESTEPAGEAPDAPSHENAGQPADPPDVAPAGTTDSPAGEGRGAADGQSAETDGPGGGETPAPAEPKDGQTADGAGSDGAGQAPATKGPSLPMPPPDHPVLTLNVADQMDQLAEYARAGKPHRFAVHGRVSEPVDLGGAGEGVLWLGTKDEPRSVAVRLPAASVETVLKQLALPRLESLAGRRIMVDGALSWSVERAAPMVEAAALDRLRRIDPAGGGVIDAHASGALVWAAMQGEPVDVHGRITSTRLLDEGRVAVWDLATREAGPAVRVALSRRLFKQAEAAVGKASDPLVEGRFVMVRGRAEYLLKPDAVRITARRIQPPDQRRTELASNAAVVQATDYQQIQALLKRGDRNRYAFQGRVDRQPTIVPPRGMIIMLGSRQQPVAVEAPRSAIEMLQNRFGPRARQLVGQVIQVIGFVEQPGRSVPTINIESAGQIQILEAGGG